MLGMKIVLSGGGTLGPVVPLLAIAGAYQKANPKAQFIWVGTRNGPEKELVKKMQIPFYRITAGKYRRYLSFWNLVDLFRIFTAFIQSIIFLYHEKPDLLISAGGFVSVPLHWAGRLLKIPAWVHQQDMRPGLANRLMAKAATQITTAVRQTMRFFNKNKTEWIGNPTRNLKVDDIRAAKKRLGIEDDEPVIFALGGGTGSAHINKMVLEALSAWPKSWHVIHLVGSKRSSRLPEYAAGLFKNYKVYKFFTKEMKDAYAAADVVVARAGFGTITELASLSKPAVLLPISRSHQEDNVKFLAEREAAVILDEIGNTGLKLAKVVKDLIEKPERRKELGQKLHEVMPPAKEQDMVRIIDKLVMY